MEVASATAKKGLDRLLGLRLLAADHLIAAGFSEAAGLLVIKCNLPKEH